MLHTKKKVSFEIITAKKKSRNLKPTITCSLKNTKPSKIYKSAMFIKILRSENQFPAMLHKKNVSFETQSPLLPTVLKSTNPYFQCARKNPDTYIPSYLLLGVLSPQLSLLTEFTAYTLYIYFKNNNNIKMFYVYFYSGFHVAVDFNG